MSNLTLEVSYSTLSVQFDKKSNSNSILRLFIVLRGRRSSVITSNSGQFVFLLKWCPVSFQRCVALSLREVFFFGTFLSSRKQMDLDHWQLRKARSFWNIYQNVAFREVDKGRGLKLSVIILNSVLSHMTLIKREPLYDVFFANLRALLYRMLAV